MSLVERTKDQVTLAELRVKLANMRTCARTIEATRESEKHLAVFHELLTVAANELNQVEAISPLQAGPVRSE